MSVAGTVPSLDELYRREYRSTMALAYALTGSASAAEELTQDAFLEAHKAWNRIAEYDDPAAWVRRVVSNRAVSGLRRRLVEARALTRLANRRVLAVELPPDDEAFWTAVRRLPGRQAQVVALHYLEDRSVADIAAVLDISPGHREGAPPPRPQGAGERSRLLHRRGGLR